MASPCKIQPVSGRPTSYPCLGAGRGLPGSGRTAFALDANALIHAPKGVRNVRPAIEGAYVGAGHARRSVRRALSQNVSPKLWKAAFGCTSEECDGDRGTKVSGFWRDSKGQAD